MAQHIDFHKPTYSFRNKMLRLVWALVYVFLFRPTIRNMHFWRIFLLKAFGAKIGRNCKIYQSVRIWAPWNLECRDFAVIAPMVEIYNPQKILVGRHATISQNAYLCGATHDYNDVNFTLVSKRIVIGDYSWIAAHVKILPGLCVGEGVVVALGSVVTKDLQPWTVYAGVPAKPIGMRDNFIN